MFKKIIKIWHNILDFFFWTDRNVENFVFGDDIQEKIDQDLHLDELNKQLSDKKL